MLASVAADASRAAVLGIDAAWTARNPSGVALVTTRGSGWRCHLAAPSYSTFIEGCAGGPIDWTGGSRGEPPAPQALARAVATTTDLPLAVVAIDMPLARRAITGRRTADRLVSTVFGSRHCAAHSPTSVRPGHLSQVMKEGFEQLGFALVTTHQGVGRKSLLEVYPHPALLALLGRSSRVPYKVSRAGRYWPELDPQARLRAILAELKAIYGGLEAYFGPLPFRLPDEAQRPSDLKPFEDAIDALISAWVGTLFLEGAAEPLGDDDAAIWCPRTSIGQGQPSPPSPG